MDGKELEDKIKDIKEGDIIELKIILDEKFSLKRPVYFLGMDKSKEYILWVETNTSFEPIKKYHIGNIEEIKRCIKEE